MGTRPTYCYFISNNYLLTRLKSFQVRASIESPICSEASLSLTQLSACIGVDEKPCAKDTMGRKGSLPRKKLKNIIDSCFRYHLCDNCHLWGGSHLCNNCEIWVWIELLGSLNRRPLGSPGGTGTQQGSKPISVCMFTACQSLAHRVLEHLTQAQQCKTGALQTPQGHSRLLQCSSPEAVAALARLSLLTRTHQHSHTVPVLTSRPLRNTLYTLGVTAASWAGQTPCLQLCPPLSWDKQAGMYTAWLLSPQGTHPS